VIDGSLGIGNTLITVTRVDAVGRDFQNIDISIPFIDIALWFKLSACIYGD
jgi:hypothetical protein